MNAASNLVSIIPPAPRVPSDYIFLLTFVSNQTEVQTRRVALSAALEEGVDLEGATCADEL
jgi:hypothetical protein